MRPPCAVCGDEMSKGTCEKCCVECQENGMAALMDALKYKKAIEEVLAGIEQYGDDYQVVELLERALK